jgi:hypothetical protein
VTRGPPQYILGVLNRLVDDLIDVIHVDVLLCLSDNPASQSRRHGGKG